MKIRIESIRDQSMIRSIHESAFDTSAEADLVDALRDNANPQISLVAVTGGELVGHILFTPVMLQGHPDLKWMGLAPLAVRPDLQGRGIGSALVQSGLEKCRESEVTAAFVLGDPEFYSRFGFEPAALSGVRCKYDVPEDAFMLVELEPDAVSGRSGLVSYHSAFDEL